MPSKYGGIDVVEQSKYGGVSTEEQAAPEPVKNFGEQATAIGKDLARQVGLTVRDVGEGAAGLIGMFTDPVTAIMNSALPEGYKIDYAREGVSKILTTLGVPDAENKAERIVKEIVGGMTGAALGAGIAGKAAQVATGTGKLVAEAMASQPVQQMVAGATAGGAQQTAAEYGAGPVGQTVAGLVGGAAGGMSMEALGRQRPDLAAIKAAEDLKIPVMTTDVMPPQTATGKMAQGLTEKTFLGTGAKRAQQQTARIDAIKSVANDFGATAVQTVVDNPAIDDVTRQLLIKRGADVEKYANLKGDVIKRLDANGPVPVDRAVAAVDHEIQRLSSISDTAYKPAIDRLEQFKADIANKSLTNIEGNRKLLGDFFTDPNITNIRTEGEKSMRAVYGALKEDMGEFIKATGQRQDYTKWRVADKRLSYMIDELNNNALKSVLKTGADTPENVGKMLFSSKPSDVRRLYKNLSPEGRANARTAILQKMIKDSDGFENLSPAKFATQLKKTGSQIGIFFTGDDLKKMEGLTKALKLTRRANEAGVATLTGYQTLPLIGGAVLQQMTGSVPGAVAVATGIGGLSRAIESPAGRKTLMEMAKIAETDPEQYKLLKRFWETVQLEYDKEQEKK